MTLPYQQGQWGAAALTAAETTWDLIAVSACWCRGPADSWTGVVAVCLLVQAVRYTGRSQSRPHWAAAVGQQFGSELAAAADCASARHLLK